MTRLFVSYSSKNRDQVNQLVRLLQDAGYEVWYDQQIRTGQWWNVILENIRACDIFLYAVTPEYLASYPCDLEYRYAQVLNRPMCPLRLSEIDFGRVPSHIALAQVIDVSGIDKNSRSLPVLLIRALRDLEQQRIPLPNPLPPEPDAPIMKLNEVIERISQLDMPLSPDDQKSLLDDIRVLLYRPESRANARYALELYRKRAERDLRMLAHISYEIEALLDLSAGNNPQSAQPVYEQSIKEVQPTSAPITSRSKNTQTPTIARSTLLPVIGLIVIVVVLLGIGSIALVASRSSAMPTITLVSVALNPTTAVSVSAAMPPTSTFTPVFTNTSPSTLTITPSLTNTSRPTNTLTVTATASITNSPQPTDTQTITLTPSITDTPQPTRPPTATSIFAASGIKTTFAEDFIGTPKHYVALQGNRYGWAQTSGSTNTISPGMGVFLEFQLDFQATTPGEMFFSLNSGNFGSATFLGWDIWHGANGWEIAHENGSNYVSLLPFNFSLAPSKWYDLLWRINANGTIDTLLWSKDNPSIYILNDLQRSSYGTDVEWRSWTFFYNLKTADIKIARYEELQFPDGYKFPDTPPTGS